MVYEIFKIFLLCKIYLAVKCWASGLASGRSYISGFGVVRLLVGFFEVSGRDIKFGLALC